MIELIKAEMTYKKWEYLTHFALPFLFSGLFWYLFNRVETLEFNFTEAILFGFACGLLVISMMLPKAIHKTHLEENRFHFFATLPISLKTIALIQSTPIFIVIGLVALVGFLITGVSSFGSADLPLLLMFNCVLLALAFGLCSLFIKELFNLLPKYMVLIPWIAFFGILFLNIYREHSLGIDAQLLNWRKLTDPSATMVLISICIASFIGHILLFTRMRDDFSTRRRFP